MKKKALILIVSLILALTTAYTQFQACGVRFLETSQIERHREVIENRARNPWQYRVLSEWPLELILPKGSSPAGAFFAFRVLQNFLIFLLAAAFYRRLGLNRSLVLLGMILLSWGMSYAYRRSDFEFSTYSGVIFYLVAAILIFDRRDWWIPPLTFFAALNRETSMLIPFLFLACRIRLEGGKLKLSRSSLLVFLSSFGLYLIVFFGLRLTFGWRPFGPSWGHYPGFDMLLFNLKHPSPWPKLMWTLNVLPILCLFTFRSWPNSLKRLSVSLIPIWFALNYFYLFIPEHRMMLVPLALIFVPGALFLCRGSAPRRTFLLALVVILSLTFITVYAQTCVLSFRYLRTSQLQRHQDVWENQACNPWQYRLLSEGVSEFLLRAAGAIGLTSPVLPFIFFRVVQNILIFSLAAAFYRRLGMEKPRIIFGLVLAGWGISYAFYNSDLHFSSYSGIIFYLIAVILIFDRRDWWIPPLTLLAALNRETAALIPFLFLACRIEFDAGKPKIKLQAFAVFILSVALYFSVYFGLRFLLGWRSFIETWGEPGFARLSSNLQNGRAWQNTFLTVNILPLFCLFGFKRWPKILQRAFIGMVVPWLLIHYYSKARPDETRFLLVPLIIGFIPAALRFLFPQERPESDPAQVLGSNLYS